MSAAAPSGGFFTEHRLGRTLSRWRWVLALVVVVLLLAALVTGRQASRSSRQATVYFPSAVGLYVGNDVRILGVPVGKVDSITPQASRVKVVLHYDAGQKVPADAKAAIVAQSLVAARFVQLAPAYTGGAVLPDHATITQERTAVPVEWDQFKDQLDQLAVALGPKGVNKDGALSAAIKTAAKNLSGNGADIGATLQQLNAAMTTIAADRGNAFSTVDHLSAFVQTLAQTDTDVRAFDTKLTGVSDYLADNSRVLDDALKAIGDSLGGLTDILKSNRSVLVRDVKALRQVAATVSSQRQAIADVLQVAPTALSNFHYIYDPVQPAETGVLAGANGTSPSTTVCSTLSSVGLSATQCRSLLGPLTDPFGSAVGVVPLPGTDLSERNGRCRQRAVVPGPGLTSTKPVTSCPGSGG